MKLQNDDLMVLGLAGVAVVLVLKATGFKFGKGTPKTFAQSIWKPLNPAKGFGYDAADPGDFILSGDLIRGTIADVVEGQTAGDNIPTNGEIFQSVIKSGGY